MSGNISRQGGLLGRQTVSQRGENHNYCRHGAERNLPSKFGFCNRWMLQSLGQGGSAERTNSSKQHQGNLCKPPPPVCPDSEEKRIAFPLIGGLIHHPLTSKGGLHRAVLLAWKQLFHLNGTTATTITTAHVANTDAFSWVVKALNPTSPPSIKPQNLQQKYLTDGVWRLQTAHSRKPSCADYDQQRA